MGWSRTKSLGAHWAYKSALVTVDVGLGGVWLPYTVHAKTKAEIDTLARVLQEAWVHHGEIKREHREAEKAKLLTPAPKREG